jgi:hypothetical protein
MIKDSKKYGIGNINRKLIVMYRHFMPNAINDKSVVITTRLSISRNIKLSSLITNMMRKNMFRSLPMKYCYTSVNTTLKITDYNC